MNWFVVGAMAAGAIWWIGSPRGAYRSITPRETRDLLARDPSAFLLLDVRSREEQAEGVIPGAVCLPFAEIERAHEHSPGRPVVVYCASGVRSRLAAAKLQRQGRPEVINLSGGISAWKSAGLPLVSPPAVR